MGDFAMCFATLSYLFQHIWTNPLTQCPSASLCLLLFVHCRYLPIFKVHCRRRLQMLIQSGNSPRWLPQVEGEMQCSSNFPLAKMLRLSIELVGLQEIQVGVTALDVDLHTDTNNFAPNEFKGVVNSSGLAVYKGSTQEIITVPTESKERN